jgi:hypothetical protein
MDKKSTIEGSAPHAIATAVTLPTAILFGPLALLLYPLMVWAGKTSIADDMDKKHLKATQKIAKTWNHARPHEKLIEISDVDTSYWPFEATRKHVFTRSNTTPHPTPPIDPPETIKPFDVSRYLKPSTPKPLFNFCDLKPRTPVIDLKAIEYNIQRHKETLRDLGIT